MANKRKGVPALRCVCGYSFGVLSRSAGFLMIPDKYYMKVIAIESTRDEKIAMRDSANDGDSGDGGDGGHDDEEDDRAAFGERIREILEYCTSGYHCPNCDRLLVLMEGEDVRYKVYEPSEAVVRPERSNG